MYRTKKNDKPESFLSSSGGTLVNVIVIIGQLEKEMALGPGTHLLSGSGRAFPPDDCISPEPRFFIVAREVAKLV